MDNNIIYTVNSDISDDVLYAEFKTKDKAIEYAKQHLDKLPFVDELEVSYDARGEVDNVFSYKTVWSHNELEYPTTEDEEEDYWDMLCAEYEDQEDGRHALSGTFNGINADELVETLEENETEVECKECFDIFPKDQCIKVAFGYICPTCSKCEVADDEIFKMDFPEYEKFSSENEMIPDEPNPEPMPDNSPNPDPMSEIEETENELISEPEEAVPFLVKDEEEAIAGYEAAEEVVADSDLENKEEILDTIDHIKEEEEEHIEELNDLVATEEDPVSEDENDPISNPTEEAEPLKEDYIADLSTPISKDFLYNAIVTEGDVMTLMINSEEDANGNTIDQSWEILDADGIFSVVEHFYNIEKDEVEDGDFVFESDDFDTFYAALARKYPDVFIGNKKLTEHVNEEHPAIESDQELKGTDNAVVKCKVADVVTHSEDEKPVDCDGKKKPLKKPLTEESNGIIYFSQAINDDIIIRPWDLDRMKKLDAEVCRIWEDADKAGLIDGAEEEQKLCDQYGIETFSGVELLDKLANDAGIYWDVIERMYQKEIEEDAVDSLDKKKSLTEETHAKYAKPEGDRKEAYNNALKYAKKDNVPYIYGYSGTNGKFFAFGQPVKVTGDIVEKEKEFKSRYKNCKVVYVAYPGKAFMEGYQKFTPEEMEEYGIDEDGNSIEGYDEYVRCTWCEDIFTKDMCGFEADLGWLCDRCQMAISSRGERLSMVINPTEDDIKKVYPDSMTEDIPMTSAELIDKYGTDDVDLINAGKEPEERVELKEEAPEYDLTEVNKLLKEIREEAKREKASTQNLKEASTKSTAGHFELLKNGEIEITFDDMLLPDGSEFKYELDSGTAIDYLVDLVEDKDVKDLTKGKFATVDEICDVASEEGYVHGKLDVWSQFLYDNLEELIKRHTETFLQIARKDEIEDEYNDAYEYFYPEDDSPDGFSSQHAWNAWRNGSVDEFNRTHGLGFYNN